MTVIMNEQPKLCEIDLSKSGTEFDVLVQHHLPVKVRNLFPDTVVPFSLYLPAFDKSEQRLDLEIFLKEGNLYANDLHRYFDEQSIPEVYIDKGRQNEFFSYFNQHLRKVLDSQEIQPEEKTRLLYDHAEDVIKKVFREKPTPSNVRLGQQLVGQIATQFSMDNVSADALFSLFSKDYYTFSHCVQVAMLGMSFCRFLKWSAEEVADFGLGAFFHDIGKNCIDEDLLNKPGRLTPDEFELVKRHAVMGYQQLRSAQLVSRDQLSVVLQHHEAADGSGYPQRLKGLAIHRYARVAHIVDCFDALTTRRPYKEALPHSTALQIMSVEMRESFDPQLLKAFITFIAKGNRMRDALEESHMSVEIGTQVVIQFQGDETRLKTLLVGMEAGSYLILRIPRQATVDRHLKEGRQIVGRYAHQGSVFGFKATILGHIRLPLRLLFVSFPVRVENVNLRKEPRIDCHLPAEAEVQGTRIEGFLGDLSSGGCRFLGKEDASRLAEGVVPGTPVTIRSPCFEKSGIVLIRGIIRTTGQEEGKPGFGIQFAELAPEAIRSFKECVDRIMTPAR